MSLVSPPDVPSAIASRVVVQPVKFVVAVNLTALAYPEPDGGYSVRVPALPGCFTEGDDIEQVQRMVIEAAEGWLAVKHDMVTPF